MRLLVQSLLVLLVIGCSTPEPKLVTNNTGKYSLLALPDWISSVDSVSTRILKTEFTIVTATIYVTVGESGFETLEESVTNYVGSLPSELVDYKALGSGQTQINGVTASWHKLKETNVEKNIRFQTLLYVLQPKGRKLYVISCSAPEDTFTEFEESFNKIAFSLKILE